jgi:hypothetical protein
MDVDLFVPPGDADLDDREDWDAPPVVQAVCGACSVQVECFRWAVETDAWGYWAGTSRHQRRQLRRPRTRLACPVCTNTVTTTTGRVQVCLACGRSWRTNRQPVA